MKKVVARGGGLGGGGVLPRVYTDPSISGHKFPQSEVRGFIVGALRSEPNMLHFEEIET